jgi:hypothetical protein
LKKRDKERVNTKERYRKRPEKRIKMKWLMQKSEKRRLEEGGREECQILTHNRKENEAGDSHLV